MPQPVLLVVGDLVEDVVVHVSDPEPRWGTDSRAEVHRRRGGSAANVAAAAAALGGRARFVGRVGDDIAGRMLADDLASAGVECRIQVGGRTGTIVVVVDGRGERTMLPDRGASTALEDPGPAVLDDVSALHVPLYSLDGEPLATTVRTLAARLHARGRSIVSVDASSRGLIHDLGRQAASDAIASLRPDVLFATADEADALGLPGPLSTWWTVVKDGAADVVLYDSTGASTSVPVPPVERVVDTTGAGDAFAAGWLLAWMSGADAVAATQGGIAAAARTLGVTGAGLAPR